MQQQQQQQQEQQQQEQQQQQQPQQQQQQQPQQQQPQPQQPQPQPQQEPQQERVLLSVVPGTGLYHQHCTLRTQGARAHRMGPLAAFPLQLFQCLFPHPLPPQLLHLLLRSVSKARRPARGR